MPPLGYGWTYVSVIQLVTMLIVLNKPSIKVRDALKVRVALHA